MSVRFRKLTGIPLVLVCMAILSPAKIALANGWEHLAVPRESLLAALNSGNAHTMEHAAISMGIRGEARDVAPLLNALKQAQGSHHLRAEIYRAFGLIGDPQATQTLLKAMKSESRAELRGTAVISLGAIGSAESLPPLLEALETEEDSVRLRVIDALGAFDGVNSVDTLKALAQQDENPEEKVRALHALGATGSADATAPLLAELADNSDRPGQRRLLATVVDALANIAPPNATEPLTELLNNTDDPILQVKLTVALGAIGGSGVITTLSALLESDNRSVQSIATRLLADAKKPGTTSELNKLYKSLAQLRPVQVDSRDAPQDTAAWLSDLDLMKLNVRALLETNPVDALDSFVDAAGIRRFNRTSARGVKLASKVYELRRLAIYSLGYTESKMATQLLLSTFASETDSRLRSVAIRSLGVLGYPDSFNVVLDAITDDHAEVRSTSAVVLGRLRNQDAVPALINAIRDKHIQVRLEAVTSLGLLADERAIEPLQKIVAQDNNDKVREHARQALYLLNKPD